jgi:hypothetical protein
VAVLALPVMTLVSHRGSPLILGASVGAILLAMVAPNSLYLVSQRELYGQWRRRLCWLPVLTCIGIGIAVSNTRAVLEAVLGRPSDFIRTPKRGDRALQHYAATHTVQPWLELALGAYCAASLVIYLGMGGLVIAPLLALYAGSFLLVGALGLAEIRRSRGPVRPRSVRLRPGRRPLKAGAIDDPRLA